MSNEQKEAVNLDELLSKSATDLIAAYGSKSKAIRGLNDHGAKVAQIAKALDIRYQHARNVLNKPLKRLIKEQREQAKKEEAVKGADNAP